MSLKISVSKTGRVKANKALQKANNEFIYKTGKFTFYLTVDKAEGVISTLFANPVYHGLTEYIIDDGLELEITEDEKLTVRTKAGELVHGGKVFGFV